MLLHRYAFNNGTANDYVGGAAYAGSLMGGVSVIRGQTNLTKSSQYVNLPSGLFGSFMALSVEAWVTTGTNSNSNTGWARIFQFGADLSNTNTLMVLICGDAAVCSQGNFLVQWIAGNGASSYGATSVVFSGQTNMHVVMTVSAGDYARLYINGVLAGITTAVVSPLPPATVFYIGKSFVSGHAGLVGLVDEFRIWGGILSATDVATRFSQGQSEFTHALQTLIQIVVSISSLIMH